MAAECVCESVCVDEAGDGSCLVAAGYSTQLQMLIYFCAAFHTTKWLPSSSCYEINPDHKTLKYFCTSVKHTVLYSNKISCCFGEILLK